MIDKIITDVGTEDMSALRKALRDAFPSPPRKHHPYKTWLDEIKVQLGTKKRKLKPTEDIEGQGELF